MLINEIIDKYYNTLNKKYVNNRNIALPFGMSGEDILQEVLMLSIRKFKNKDIPEEEGINYIKRNLYYRNHFAFSNKDNDIIFTDTLIDKPVYMDMDI